MTHLTHPASKMRRAGFRHATCRALSRFLPLVLLIGGCEQAEPPSELATASEGNAVTTEWKPFTAVIKFYGLIAWAEAKRTVDDVLGEGHYALLADADHPGKGPRNRLPPCSKLAPTEYPPHFSVLRFSGHDLVGSGYSGTQVFSIKLRDVEIKAPETGGNRYLAKLKSVGSVSSDRAGVDSKLLRQTPTGYANRLAARAWIPKGLGTLTANVLGAEEYCSRKIKHCRDASACNDGDSQEMADELVLTIPNLKKPLEIHVADFSGAKLPELLFAPPEPDIPNQSIEIRIMNETSAGIFEKKPDPGDHLDAFRWFYRLSKNQGQGLCSTDRRICAKGVFNSPRCPQVSFP